MTRKIRWLLFLTRLIVIVYGCLPMTIMAEEGVKRERVNNGRMNNEKAKSEKDDSFSAVLPVAVGYQGEDGKITYYFNGTSFLINEEAVLTNKHTAVPDETLRQKIMKEHGLTELQEGDKRLGIYIMAGSNLFIPAELHENVQSDRMDFAVLKSSVKIYDREVLTLGDMMPLEIGEHICAVGFSEGSYQEKISEEILQTKEWGNILQLRESEGVPDGENNKVIEHDGLIHRGNSGSPLLNEKNEVVGFNVFREETDSYAVQIYHIRKALDTFEIPYKKAEEIIEEKKTGEGIEQTEKNQMVNLSETDRSTDTRTEETKEMKTGGTIFSVLGGIAGMTGAVVTVWMAFDFKKKRDAEERMKKVQKEQRQMRAWDGQERQVSQMARIGYPPTVRRREKQEEREKRIKEEIEVSEGAGETMLLNAGIGETTLLRRDDFAYLFRKNTGERILINAKSFLIGKEERKVNYCVKDNSSVSRCHANITKNGGQYFIEDQNSTNGTFVNEKKLRPYQRIELSDEMIIKLADEVFEFHFM